MEWKEIDIDGMPALESKTTGEIRKLGLILPQTQEETNNYNSAMPLYNGEIIDESKWEECDDTHLLGPVLDQGPTNGCAGWSLAGAAQAAFNMFGVPMVFHGGWIYSFCNGGRDGGSNVLECIQTAATKGFLPADASNADPYAIYQRQFPSGAAAVAQNYLLGSYSRVYTFKECVSAVLTGKLVYFGTYIGSDFEPDSEGYLPSWRGRRGGHAMFLYRKLTRRGGQWHIGVRNSWTKRWGINGSAQMPQSYFEAVNGGARDGMFQAVAIEFARKPANLPSDKLPPLVNAA